MPQSVVPLTVATNPAIRTIILRFPRISLNKNTPYKTPIKDCKPSAIGNVIA